MSQKFLDLAGLTDYDGKIKEWFKSGITDISEDPIRALFAIPDNPYVTFTAEEDNSSIGLTKLSTNQTLEYSADTTTWNTFEKTTSIHLNKRGDKVYVRGILSSKNTNTRYTQFKMSGKISASGNCNALWNYQDLNAPLKEFCGRCMFYKCESLTTAPKLPATTLAKYCYNTMFLGCSSLTQAPELPATTLAERCYYQMFSNCTSLTTAPKLPATTLAKYCYSQMFKNCSSLTTTPELPATTLAECCYYDMFQSCTSLTTAPETLPATELADGCYNQMFSHCSSLMTAPKLPATTLVSNCYPDMFLNCKSLTTAPELPATTLVSNCYPYMFAGCTSLNYIKCLATDISATDCTKEWVTYVPSTCTFIKHPDMNDWTIGNSGILEGWTVVDAEL